MNTWNGNLFYALSYPCKFIFKNHYEIDKPKAQIVFQNIKYIHMDKV